MRWILIGNNIIVHYPTQLRLFCVVLKVSPRKTLIFKAYMHINRSNTLLTFKTLTQLHKTFYLFAVKKRSFL